MTQADCNALHLRIFTCRHALVATVRRRPGKAAVPALTAALADLEWEDGRDVYDVIIGLLDYPETATHPGFTLSLQTNFEDGGGGDTYFRFVGSEGVINVSFTALTLSGPGSTGITPCGSS